MTTVSVAIIASNEQEVLPVTLECVAGLGPLVSEVVIVDGFSSDCTHNLAMQFLDRFPISIYLRKFDDFANQKNYALARCHGDWILALDADMAFNAINLKRHFERGFFDSAKVWDFKLLYAYGDLRHYHAPSGIGPTTRLFRNFLGIHYERPVHEFLCFPSEHERLDLYRDKRHNDTANICIIETSMLKSDRALIERVERYQQWSDEASRAGGMVPTMDNARYVICNRWRDAEEIPEWILMDVPKSAFDYPLAKGYPKC